MDAKLLVSTALVTPQANALPQAAAPPQGASAPRRAAEVAAVPAAPKGSNKEAGAEALAADREGTQPAATGKGAPNSALTTYRDQDSGRLIVRVYDRESGDVLVEFPPEKAFRPVGGSPKSPVAKAKTSFSV